MASLRSEIARPLLRLYPRSFRERYSAEILAALEADWNEGKSFRRLGSFLAALFNLISNALLLRLDSLPESQVALILKTPLAGDLELPMSQRSFPKLLFSDLRHAMRVLFRRPLGTILIIATVALGVGVNTAMFSVVHGVLMQPLPYPEADALVQVDQTDVANDVQFGWVSYPDYQDYLERQSVFSDMAAYSTHLRTLTGAEFPELVQVTEATASLFTTLKVYPHLGHLFKVEDQAINGPGVVVLSYNYWETHFAADEQIIGQILQIDGESMEVIGVLGPEARYPAGAQMFKPLRRELDPELRGIHDLGTIARLNSQSTVADADAQLRAIMLDLEQAYPIHNVGRGAAVRPLLRNTVRNVDDTLWLLMGAVSLILVITCANIANLLAARAEARRREVAIRCALGASPWRLVKQFLSESVLLSLMGGLAGILLAALAIELLRSMAPANLPRMDEVQLDATVLLFGLGVSIVTGILFGLLPARLALRQQHAQDLKDGARGADSAGSGGVRKALVVVQLALAFVLVSGTSLLMRSLIKAGEIDPGFVSQGLVSAGVSLPQSKYPWSWRDFPHGPAVVPFYDRLYQALERQPALAQFALAMQGPADPTWTSQIDVPNQGPHAPTAQQEEFIRQIGPNYLATTGIPLLAGRGFTAQDRGDSVPVVLVNESFVRKYFGDASAIGETLNFWGVDREIIGVVKDVRFQGVDQQPWPAVYGALLQNPSNSISVVARSAGDSDSALTALRTALAEVDREIALKQLSTVDQLLDGKLSARRFNLVLFGVFAILAATLAFIGVYGVMSFLVSTRRFEFGVRLSFGATATDLLRDTLGRAAKLCLIGLGFGLPIALLGASTLASMLVEVSSVDPLSYLLVVVVMLTGVVLASLIPARKAAASDPLNALRAQ